MLYRNYIVNPDVRPLQLLFPLICNHINLDPFCPFTDIYTFFVCVVIFASFANGAPQNHHRHGHQSYTSTDDDSDTKMEWLNPCGGFLATAPTRATNETRKPKNVSFEASFARLIHNRDFSVRIYSNFVTFLFFFAVETFKATERRLTEFYRTVKRA